MYIKDIRAMKKKLRTECRQFREQLFPEQKAVMDKRICGRIRTLREYGDAPLLYTYVSKKQEVDTFGIIRSAYAAGKRVAVPRCVPQTTGMDFYEICSLGDLESGCYGVMEPVPEKCAPARDFGGAMCIVPGLSFDSQGYRLGYGKGYYDRFLANFKGTTVGICYSGCMRWNLPHGYFDRPVDILITEKFIRRTAARKPDR